MVKEVHMKCENLDTESRCSETLYTVVLLRINAFLPYFNFRKSGPVYKERKRCFSKAIRAGIYVLSHPLGHANFGTYGCTRDISEAILEIARQ